MKIAAYQFAVTGDICENYKIIEHAVKMAIAQNIRLLVFPECALTGYPPLEIDSCQAIDFPRLNHHIEKLRRLAIDYNLYIICGMVLQDRKDFHNSMLVFAPDGTQSEPYHKRALWGWDKDQFIPGQTAGVYQIDNYRIGVRICFEVRFPEYFRELFKAETDLNIVAFSDTNNEDNLGRYELIKALLVTRACENACPILSVNHIKPYQTAPTVYINENGKILAEAEHGAYQLLIADFVPRKSSFGTEGRLQISRKLLIK